MADDLPGDDDYRRRCLAVILLHTPVRSWKSMWRIRCGFCGLSWAENGDLVGCLPVMEATAELAGMPGPRLGSYKRVWPR